MEVAKNYRYLYSPNRCKVEQPDALQHNGMTSSASLEERERGHQAVLSEEILRVELKGRPRRN